jgi:hypothetical protein
MHSSCVSRDISVRGPGEAEPTSWTEVYTHAPEVRRAPNLVTGAAHATAKFPDDVLAGTAPRPVGTFAATTRLLRWPPADAAMGGDAVRHTTADGTQSILRPGANPVEAGNLFDELAGLLNTQRYDNPIGYLNEVTFLDAQGNVVARLVNANPTARQGTWAVVR